MENKELIELVSSNLKKGETGAVKSILGQEHPSAIAGIFPDLDLDERIGVLNSLVPETRSLVLLELDSELRHEILEYLSPSEIAKIAEEMDSDDIADLISELPETVAQQVLSILSPEELKEVETLLKYPEDTAGGLMQTELVSVKDTYTVRETIDWIRLIADEVEDFYEIFVTDEHDRLCGHTPLKQLILSSHTTVIKDIMEEVEATVTPYIDQEEVADIVKKYDIMSLPVVDDHGKLLGRITADDVIDVITEEASEDILHLAGVADYSHPIYTPTFVRVKSRIPWILLGLVGELIIAFIIVHHFKPTLEKLVILAAFMPVIMATGGNVGIQATTIVVRGLGMGSITPGQMLKVMTSELKLGLSLGITSGAVAAVVGYIISMSEPQVLMLSVAIFIAITTATIATTFTGVITPFLLYKMRFDPAVASSPFVTMSNDIFGSTIFLFIAMLLF